MFDIQNGEKVLFNDFENDGEMWTGSGSREIRHLIIFERSFETPPSVQLSISLFDAVSDNFIRYELVPENITSKNFELVFRTWSDSKFARLRATWMAFGSINEDDWDV